VTAPHAWGDLDRPAPQSVVVQGTDIRKGSRVRLHPHSGGDIMDAALTGRVANVEGIDESGEGTIHVAVTVEDDPGRDLGDGRFPGHRFFFQVDEIEPIDGAQAPASPRVLVAGIGNIFFGDDGFGVAVARRLAERAAPPGVTVMDFGIRGLDLAYAMQGEYDAVILVDAVPGGGTPGTLYVIEPDADTVDETAVPDGHRMDPVTVLRLARTLGRVPRRTLVVGCEPEMLASAESDEATLVQLSPAVHAAIEEAVELVESLVAELTTEPQPESPP
jgi:hydrogenase maturation protease